MLNKIVGIDVEIKPIMKSASKSLFGTFYPKPNGELTKLNRPYGYYEGDKFVKVDVRNAVKGFKVSKDKYCFFNPDEIKALGENVSQEIEILGKAFENELPKTFLATAKYQIVGNPDSPSANMDIAALTQGLSLDNSILICKFCIRSRSKFGVLFAYKNALILQELSTDIANFEEMPKVDISKAVEWNKITDALFREKFINFEYKDNYLEAVKTAVAKKLENPEFVIEVAELKHKVEKNSALELLKMSIGDGYNGV